MCADAVGSLQCNARQDAQQYRVGHAQCDVDERQNSQARCVSRRFYEPRNTVCLVAAGNCEFSLRDFVALARFCLQAFAVADCQIASRIVDETRILESCRGESDA
jgi:hypothetical protein